MYGINYKILMIKATIIGFIDFMRNYGDYDLIYIRGGAGNFIDLEKYLMISIKLHNPQSIILVIHEDCGYNSVKTDL